MRLGPYEVMSAVGAGGMGEVYKARDTRLDRIVAVKVLPAHLADKPDLRERFEREARAIAALNHPNICTVYDVGHQGGIDFLVMEYLEGETLGLTLLKGPLPLDKTLRCAVEIADALDKAHRKGITHRDIKPGNIIITKTGVKLLDFGLAKLKQDVQPAAMAVSQLPTLGQNPTVEGTLLGTLQYMAPEQVEGKTDAIDARTDIFAFGAVLYEMATGRKAFEGKSTASLIAKILETEPPPIAALQPLTPPAFERIIKRCLAKNPDERWQTATDLAQELRWIAASVSQTGVAVPTSATAKAAERPWLVPVTVLAAVALLAIGGIVGWMRRPPAVQMALPVTRFTIAPPPGAQLSDLIRLALAISPDGKWIAYLATRGGVRQIYLRALADSEAKPLVGTENARNIFFSRR
jgi:serine/threonine protein kinase